MNQVEQFDGVTFELAKVNISAKKKKEPKLIIHRILKWVNC